jgi:hypothetical protein
MIRLSAVILKPLTVDVELMPVGLHFYFSRVTPFLMMMMYLSSVMTA